MENARQFLGSRLPQCVFLTPIIHISIVKHDIFSTSHHTTILTLYQYTNCINFLFWFCTYCLHHPSPSVISFKSLLHRIQHFILSTSFIPSVLPCISSKVLSIHYVFNPRIVFNALKVKLYYQRLQTVLYH